MRQALFVGQKLHFVENENLTRASVSFTSKIAYINSAVKRGLISKIFMCFLNL